MRLASTTDYLSNAAQFKMATTENMQQRLNSAAFQQPELKSDVAAAESCLQHILQCNKLCLALTGTVNHLC